MKKGPTMKLKPSLSVTMLIMVIASTSLRAENEQVVIDGGRRLVDAQGELLDLGGLSSDDSRRVWWALGEDGQSKRGVLCGRIITSAPMNSVKAVAFWPFSKGEIPLTLAADGGFQIWWTGASRPYRLELSAPGAVAASLVIPFQSEHDANWGVWLGAISLPLVAKNTLYTVRIHPILDGDASRPIAGRICLERIDEESAPRLFFPVAAGVIPPFTLTHGKYRINSAIPGWYSSTQILSLSPKNPEVHIPLVLNPSRTLEVRLEDGRQMRHELQGRPTTISWRDGTTIEVTAHPSGAEWQAHGLPLAINRGDRPNILGLRISSPVNVGDQLQIMTTEHSLQVVDVLEPARLTSGERSPSPDEMKSIIPSESINEGSSNMRHGEPYADMAWIDGPGGRFTVPSTAISEGVWYLHALYASGDSRPCQILIDGQVQADGFTAATTGFTKDDVRSDQVGPLWVGRQSKVEVVPIGYSPHFRGFLWSHDAHVKFVPQHLAPKSLPTETIDF